jgi:DNA-binding transcriptional LysR family regulator
MIDLESLKIFRTVVDEGGVVRAANKLNRVQSNVTTRIRQLEDHLGTQLFRREGRSIRLSAEGRTLLTYADRLLRLADETVSEMRTGKPKGVFRLGALESTAGSRLAPILAHYHSLYPDVVVELTTGTTAGLVTRVVNFEIEAAFVSEPFTAPSLEARHVFDEQLVLVTSKVIGKVSGAADLGRSTLIAFTQGCSYRKRIEEWLGSANVMPERILEFASYQAMIACVAAGTGYAVVPKSVLEALRATKSVRQHALPKRFSHNRTFIVWNGDQSPSLRCLLSLLAPTTAPTPTRSSPAAWTSRHRPPG